MSVTPVLLPSSALAIESQRTRSKDGLSIASLNTNGLRRHSDELKLSLWKIDIDILVLNETKLNASYPSSVQRFWLMSKFSRKGILGVVGFLLILEIL